MVEKRRSSRGAEIKLPSVPDTMPIDPKRERRTEHENQSSKRYEAVLFHSQEALKLYAQSHEANTSMVLKIARLNDALVQINSTIDTTKDPLKRADLQIAKDGYEWRLKKVISELSVHFYAMHGLYGYCFRNAQLLKETDRGYVTNIDGIVKTFERASERTLKLAQGLSELGHKVDYTALGVILEILYSEFKMPKT